MRRDASKSRVIFFVVLVGALALAARRSRGLALVALSTLVLGFVMTLPVLVPIGVIVALHQADDGLSLAAAATLSVLLAVALTPFFAYLIVANVFIYLNLRYEPGERP